MHPTDPSQPLGERLQGTNLYLVGMMGSGKSTVGPLLAKALGYRFLDADAVISQAAGCSIPEIFERDGEEGFRRLERQVLQQLRIVHPARHAGRLALQQQLRPLHGMVRPDAVQLGELRHRRGGEYPLPRAVIADQRKAQSLQPLAFGVARLVSLSSLASSPRSR